MTLSIESLMVNSGPQIYYSDEWVRTIKDHVPYLKTLQSTQVLTVAADLAKANVDNPTGLLNDLKLPQEIHYLLFIVNGWLQVENVGTIETVYVPNDESIARLRKLLPST